MTNSNEITYDPTSQLFSWFSGLKIIKRHSSLIKLVSMKFKNFLRGWNFCYFARFSARKRTSSEKILSSGFIIGRSGSNCKT